jgi:shikimate kinase
VAQNYVLFGFKGCGKTTLGRLLSARLHLPFIDTDDLLGASPRLLYQTLGEAPFRSLERQAITQVAPLAHTLIALGGGAILQPDILSLFTDSLLIYLHKTPLFQGDLPAFATSVFHWQQIYLQRKPLYQAIAAHRIDLDLLSLTQALCQMEALIHGT